MRAHSIDLYLS